MKDTDLVYELRRIDKNYARYWANAELLEVTDAAANYIEKLEEALATKVAAVMPRIEECKCNQPMIICDNRGCHCERCGLPERIDWSFMNEPVAKGVDEFLTKLENNEQKDGFLDTDDSGQWLENRPEGKVCGVKSVDLPQEEWHICSTCNGKGSYLESEDAHRSEGIVPCYNCSNGWVKTKKLYRKLGNKAEPIWKQRLPKEDKPYKIDWSDGRWVLI